MAVHPLYNHERCQTLGFVHTLVPPERTMLLEGAAPTWRSTECRTAAHSAINFLCKSLLAACIGLIDCSRGKYKPPGLAFEASVHAGTQRRQQRQRAAAAAAGWRLHSCRPPPPSGHGNHASVICSTRGSCLSRILSQHGLRCVASPELGTQLPAANAKRSAVIPDSDQRALCDPASLQLPAAAAHSAASKLCGRQPGCGKSDQPHLPAAAASRLAATAATARRRRPPG